MLFHTAFQSTSYHLLKVATAPELDRLVDARRRDRHRVTRGRRPHHTRVEGGVELDISEALGVSVESEPLHTVGHRPDLSEPGPRTRRHRLGIRAAGQLSESW